MNRIRKCIAHQDEPLGGPSALEGIILVMLLKVLFDLLFVCFVGFFFFFTGVLRSPDWSQTKTWQSDGGAPAVGKAC